MRFGRTHVIGAGMSGLAAALHIAAAGRFVWLHESAGHAGGRCRSYEDPKLGIRIDNGNHLVLSGNQGVETFLKDAEAGDVLTGPEKANFPFFDLKTGERWCLRPGAGRLPWWLLSGHRRIPGTRAWDYLSALRLAYMPGRRTVKDLLGHTGLLYERFWEPLCVAVLNTEPERADAGLLWPVFKETFGRGEAACRPRIARDGLSESFVDPALAKIVARGGRVTFNDLLKALETAGGQVTGLTFGDGKRIDLGDDDAVVIALPPMQAAQILPEIEVPTETRAIVNAHFKLPCPPTGPEILGLVGGTAQWIFRRGNVLSVTVSAADDLAERESLQTAALLWAEVARAHNLTLALPEHRIVKEKRATFAQTTDQARLRPGVRTPLKNLYLAGDWTDTGLPATIEGSIRSGHRAARAVLDWFQGGS